LTCSAFELTDTDSYLAVVSTDFSAACSTDDSCSIDCLAVLGTLSSQLPDCIFTDGTNYYEGVVLIISTCGSTATSSSGSSTSTSETASRGNDSTPSSFQTLSPGITTDSASKSSSEAAGVLSISVAVVAVALGVFQLIMLGSAVMLAERTIGQVEMWRVKYGTISP
jgi:hypothetical protein